MNDIMKWDGHSHTHFCPHGNGDDLALFLERAERLGFTRYTVTEHPPIPDGWLKDEILASRIAMRAGMLPDYFETVRRHKQDYEGRLDVRVGLELDYLPGRDGYVLDMADRWHKELEDVVMSVHYLPGMNGMRCVDFNVEDFRDGLLTYYGSMERIVDEYYDNVEEAIELAAQLPGSRRIGHINLVEKFHLELPDIDAAQIERRLTEVLPLLVSTGVGVDVNMAGLRARACGKSYVPVWFMKRCRELGIQLVYGSDAHRAEHVGAGWEEYVRDMGAAGDHV